MGASKAKRKREKDRDELEEGEEDSANDIGKNCIESHNIDILRENTSNKQIIHQMKEYTSFKQTKCATMC